MGLISVGERRKGTRFWLVDGGVVGICQFDVDGVVEVFAMCSVEDMAVSVHRTFGAKTAMRSEVSDVEM